MDCKNSSRRNLLRCLLTGAALLLALCGILQPAMAQTSARVWYITLSSTTSQTGVYTINVDGSAAATNPLDISSTPSASYGTLDGLAIDPNYGHYFVANYYLNSEGNDVNQIIEGNTNGSGTPEVIYTSGHSGEDAIVGLALNPQTGLLYFAVTDANIGSSDTNTGIYYINARGTGTQTATELVNLSSDTQAPNDIAIDTENNLLFYTNGVPGLSAVEDVGVANLTTGAVINSALATYSAGGDVEPFGIAVDPATKALYWTTVNFSTNSGNAIYSATYSTGGSVTLSNTQTLATTSQSQVPIGISLDVPAGGYYADTATGTSGDTTPNEILFGSSLTSPVTLTNVYSVPDQDGGTETLPTEAIVVEDQPVVDASGTVTFIPGDGAAVIDSGATVLDADGYNLTGATVSITTGFSSGDTLGFTNQGGITGSYDAASGTLSLSGIATVANYQDALDSITFSTISSSATARTISWTVSDGVESSATATSTVDVHVAPTVTAGGTVTFDGGGSPVLLDSGLTVTDASTPTLIGAMVSIASGFNFGDTLNFTNQNSITGIFNAASGTLTLSGSASVANYQAALESVTFSTTSSSTTPRTINWTVSDSVVSSASATSTVDVLLPPAVTAGATAMFDDGGSPVPLDPGLTVTDASSSTLISAMVSIGSGFSSGDTLIFTNQNGITGSFNAGSGSLTLSGTASLLNYEAALESVAFFTTSTSTTPRIIDWTVSEGVVSSATATSTVDVLLAQTITFGAIAAQPIFSTYTLSASSSSGLPITYYTSTPSFCAINGGTVTLQAIGYCNVFATQPGNNVYGPAAWVGRNIEVVKASQSITFPMMTAQPVNTTYTLPAIASSGLAITYTTSTPTICTINGGTANLIAPGYCGVYAAQPGNTDYSPATSVARNLEVLGTPQTITFPAISPQLAQTTVTLTASASSGLPVTFTSTTPTLCTVSGNTASLLAPGYCGIEASQPGNSTYAAATAGRNILIEKAPQTITFPAMPAQPVNTTYTLPATASSGLPITYTTSTPTICTIVNGNQAQLLAVGYCGVYAAQPGNSVYAAATTVARNLQVVKD